MSNELSENKFDDNYLTIKDIILVVQDYWAAVKRNWKWIAICIGIFLAYFLYKAFTAKPQFHAEISFMVNEDELGGGGVSSILGQFSGLLGGGDKLNFQKILEIARTRKIAEKVLFKSYDFDGKNDFIANHFIDILNASDKWAPKKWYVRQENILKTFHFKHKNLDSFSRIENLALRQIHMNLLSILTTEFKEKTAMMKLKVSSESEMLSYELCRSIFEEMSNFYIDKSIEKQEETYKNLQAKADSLKAIMTRSEYGLANLKDSYRSTWLNQQDVPKTLLDRDIKTTALIYAEVVKNLELASFSLQNRTPYIQPVDEPIIPLLVTKPEWYKEMFKAIALGLLIGIGYTVAIYFYKKQMI